MESGREKEEEEDEDEGKRKYSRPMIGGEDQTEFEEVRKVLRESLLKPQEAQSASDTEPLIDHIGDGDTTIEQLLPTK